MSPKLSIVSKNKTSLDWSNEQPGMTLNINKQNITRVMKYTPTDLIMNCLSVNVLCCFMGYPSLLLFILKETVTKRKPELILAYIISFFFFTTR